MATTRKKTTQSKSSSSSRTKKSTIITNKNRFSFTKGQRALLAVAGVMAFVVVGSFVYSASRNMLAQATAFQSIGVHPQASAETTDKAKFIQELIAWNGKIYAGYGDWDANTGPVSVTPFDPATGTFAATPEFTADTEAIEQFRVIQGKLYGVHVDPRGGFGATYSVADKTSGKPVWQNVTGKVDFTHTYGLVEGFTPGEMFLVGQRDEGSATNEVAKVYRTTDGGATWSESLSVPSRGGYNRMTLIGKLGSTIYVQRMSFTDFNGTGAKSEAWAWNGSRWSAISPLTSAAYPTNSENFAGKMIFKTSTIGGNLVAFDGRSSTTIRSSIRDYVIGDDGYLYVLGYTGSEGQLIVIRTKDLTTWENVTYAPRTNSIAYLNNTLYLGGFDGDMYRAEINPNSVDSTAPKVSLVAPANGFTWPTTGTTWIAANASDAAGIHKVEFYVGDTMVTYVHNTDIDAGAKLYPGSYSTRWNGTGVPAGTYQFKAIAYDTYGNAASSAPISITIPAGLYVEDTIAPTVSITSPSTTTKNIRKSVSINASASDNTSIAYMEAQLDGRIVASQTSTSGTLYVPSVSISKGSHTLVVIAKDKAGNTSQTTRTFSSR